MREPLPLGNPRGDRHRPVDPRRDHAVDPLGLGEARDPRLVLRRDDRPTVRVAKSRRRRIAIECDHEQVALSGRASRPSCAGPAPRTRRRLPAGAGVPSTRPHSRDTSRSSVRARPRTTCAPSSRGGARPCRSSRCGGRPAQPLLDVRPHGRVLTEQREHVVGDVGHGDVDPGGDVDHLARDAVEIRRDDRLDRLGMVVDVQPVTARVAVAVNRQRLVLECLRDEARHDLLGMLEGPVVVERSHDHDRQPVRHVVRVRETVGAGLRRRVRAPGLSRWSSSMGSDSAVP